MLRFYILLALPMSLFLGCGSYDEVNTFSAEKCGKSYYNINTQFCYNAKIYDKCGAYGLSYDPTNQKCKNNILFSMCVNSFYNQATQFCQNSKIYDKCDGLSYDPLNQKCENNSLLSKCGNEWYSPSSEYCAGNVIENKKEFTDSRDGKTYKYVTIGTQTWMAENLRYKTSNTKCYDNNPDNCEIYGILYDWNTANKVCPSGWHLPNDTEWFTLRRFAGSDDAKLMANHVFWISGKGTDEYGFTALPGGFYRDAGYFLDIENRAAFWSATEGYMANSAHIHIFTLQSGIRDIDGLYTDNSWANVRCIKDI